MPVCIFTCPAGKQTLLIQIWRKMIMNDPVYAEPAVDLSELFWNIMLQWRVIALSAILAAAVAGGLSWLKSKPAAPVTAADNKVASAYYEESLKSIDEGIARYQAALKDEKEYLEKSLFMQLDPFHLYLTTTQYEISALAKECEEGDLLSLGQAYATAAVDAGFLGELAEKYETEPQYLAELIATNVPDSTGTSTPSGSAADAEEEETGEASGDDGQADATPATTYYLTVQVTGKDQAFSDELSQAIEDYFLTVGGDFGYVKHTIRVRTRIREEKVKRAIRANQKAVWDRIYDYSDKLVKAATNRENFVTKYKSGSAKKTQAPGKRKISKKYVAAGFAGGILLSMVLIGFFYLTGGKIKSGRDLRSRFGIRILGNISGDAEGKKRLALDRLTERKAFPDADGRSREQCLQMTAANIGCMLKGKKHVVLTGSGNREALSGTAASILDALPEEGRASLTFSPDFLHDPESRKGLADAEGVILLERRGKTSYTDLEEELQLLEGMHAEILGAVVS